MRSIIHFWKDIYCLVLGGKFRIFGFNKLKKAIIHYQIEKGQKQEQSEVGLIVMRFIIHFRKDIYCLGG